MLNNRIEVPEYDDDYVLPGALTPTTVDVSTQVSWSDTSIGVVGDGVDRIFPPSKAEAVRFAVLPGFAPRMVWQHWLVPPEGKVCVVCHSERGPKHTIIKPAPCCIAFEADAGAQAKQAIAVLAVKYDGTDASGKYPVGADAATVKFGLGWLRLSGTAFAALAKLIQKDQDVTDIDVAMSVKENGIGYNFTQVSRKPRHLSNPTLFREVMEAAKVFQDPGVLARKLGKVVTSAEMSLLVKSCKPLSQVATVAITEGE